MAADPWSCGDFCGPIAHTTRATLGRRDSQLRIRSLGIAGAIVTLTFMTTAVSPAPIRAATPTFVQARATEITGGKTNNVTFTQANAVGNLLVVSVLWSNAGLVSLKDSRGNGYVSVAPRRAWGSAWSEQTFYARNVAG